jgi:hypothetical protein
MKHDLAREMIMLAPGRKARIYGQAWVPVRPDTEIDPARVGPPMASRSPLGSRIRYRILLALNIAPR